MRLNPNGARYAHRVRETLERLAGTPSTDGNGRWSRSLEIAVLPTFASRWLIPRLSGF
ncbi:DNA-binding transcriptional activator GcvA [Raoultella terrigena]|uniref:DNA-binding transcriptional activator GcvA n=1 Tax=Raoultella terrigena TaxID=577 RepID=A0A4U9CZS4_RAOTE|nr:DNA-binding transcriptional activator GcvA [Raoultella terrigena]